MVGLEMSRESDRALSMHIAEAILDRIDDGELLPGERLPTVRDLAGQLSVTRVTVHNAYSHLQDKGYVDSTVGRGSFVSDDPPIGPMEQHGPESSSRWRGGEDSALQLLLSRDVTSLALAEPDPVLAPAEEYMEIINRLKDHATTLLRYGSTEGDPELRAVIAQHLKGRGVECNPDDLLITNGSTQALSLIVHTLARPGERVLVEQPTYFGFLSILRSLELLPVAVPMDKQGPDPEALERLILRERPRFFYTMPTFHNPTGVTTTLERREAMILLANRYALPIIEDDIFRELSYGPTPPVPMKSLDERGQVFYVDSFSKNFLPGLRIGYLLAPPPFRARISTLLYSSTLGNAHVLQRALAEFMLQGKFASHIKKVTPLYKKRRDALMSALQTKMPQEGVEWTVPEGGFCCWVTLPEDTPMSDLAHNARERGVAFTPGHLFEANPRKQSRLRLCFGTQKPDQIRRSVAILGELVSELLERGPVRAVGNCRTAPLV
jgi:DNA-binding transcriptional MocR family regulator